MIQVPFVEKTALLFLPQFDVEFAGQLLITGYELGYFFCAILVIINLLEMNASLEVGRWKIFSVEAGQGTRNLSVKLNGVVVCQKLLQSRCDLIHLMNNIAQIKMRNLDIGNQRIE